MTPLLYEMTQGDSFYAELAFVDQYGSVVDVSTWTLSVGFKTAYADAVPAFSLTVSNGGIIAVETGVIALNIRSAILTDIDIDPRPKNGDLIPWRWLYGELQMTPPALIEFSQGDGARTSILIKVYAGIA
ncbi:hypothetical protein [Rhodopila sp.]|uniref:hypothetical protein n=1 Tax=Rhodopila sp. TaxID=2480087 RepID=UPI003D1247F1